MLLDILRADPAGNITIFVLTEVPKEKRAETASKLMAIEQFGAEQVGFLTEPADSRCLCRLEMMGGEFCGNASRALALYLAKKHGVSGKMLIGVSGSPEPVEVWADTEKGEAFAKMPLPKRIEPFILSGIDCMRVDLDGISHLIAESEMPDKRIVIAAEGMFDEDGSIAAYGMLFFNKYDMSMIPFVKVKETGSFVREGSCGSGTTAVAASLCVGLKDGKESFTLSQPAGVITAEVEKKDGKFKAVSIGGSVRLDAPQKVEI